jgi:peptidase E
MHNYSKESDMLTTLRKQSYELSKEYIEKVFLITSAYHVEAPYDYMREAENRLEELGLQIVRLNGRIRSLAQ